MAAIDPSAQTAYPYTGTDVLSVSDMTNLTLYSLDPTAGLLEINGGLDEDNVSNSTVVASRNVIPGDHAKAWQSSSNMSLDYFYQAFNQRDGLSNSVSMTIGVDARPIPGASRRFWMPWSGAVLIMWTVFWTNNRDINSTASRSRGTDVYLEFDGTPVTHSRRRVIGGVDDTGGTAREHLGHMKSRVYSGHHMETSVSEGWHDADMMVMSNQARQSRFWARNMTVVAFRRES